MELIDRQAAIAHAISGRTREFEGEKWIRVSEVKESLKTMPPAQPERKTVIYSGDGYADGCMVYDLAECPQCGYAYEDGDKDWGEPYCPHCGQLLDWEMRGEQ